MFPSQALRSIYLRPLSSQLSFIKSTRAFSSRTTGDNEEDLDAARQWFATFHKATIPASVAKTTYSRSSGPGGQKVNKTSSKATTVWPLSSLRNHVPKILIAELKRCRYYVLSSDSITIQSDASRGKTENTEDTHRKFTEELTRLYKERVPGVTTLDQKARVEQLVRTGLPRTGVSQKMKRRYEEIRHISTRTSKKKGTVERAARLADSLQKYLQSSSG